MQKPRSHTVIATLTLLCGWPSWADAQRTFFGAGVGVASLPRTLTPLCGSARRLTGASLSAHAGFLAKRFRISAGVEGTARGHAEAADCLPKAQVSVDSAYAPGGSAALAGTGEVWYPATRRLALGVGTGWVLDHDSWFVSVGVGWQTRNLRVEIAARRHQIAFDEVTTEFGSGTTREISRFARTERSWGGVIRVVLVTR